MRTQLNPLQISKLDNSIRFGIDRRSAKKREIKVELVKLKNLLKEKNITDEQIDIIFNEINVYYKRSFQMMLFYRCLPLSQEIYELLGEIIPKDKFMIPCEKFLFPTNSIGTIQFERGKDFLDLFDKMDKKLHQSDKDSCFLIIELNRRFIEDMGEKIFFYKKWEIFKPVRIKIFQEKNRDNIDIIFKEINILVGHSNSEIINFIKERLDQAKKINKGAK